MKLPRFQLGLPLLARELVEQAARRRTYVIRVTYACLLFLASFLFFYDELAINSGNAFAALGHGRQMFETLMGLQFAGIYLFMPAITCGVLTQEKERNSLALVFLTKLGPWTILFEKLLSRLFAMLGFLLLSLPLLAFAYTLGGISQSYLWSGVWMLAVTTVQVGTLALACSTYFRTTVAAFIATYLIGLVMLFGWPIAEELNLVKFVEPNGTLQRLCQELGLISNAHELPFLFFGPVAFFEGSSASGRFMNLYGMAITGGVVEFLASAIRTLPIIFSSLFWLVVARVFIVRRAFAPPRNLVLKLFKVLDGFFLKVNQNRLTRGIVLIKEGSALPEGEPVAWRETTKKSLGTTRYLFRVLAAIEIPVAVCCVLIAATSMGSSGRDSLVGSSLMLFLLWFIAVLMVSVKAASLIAGERSHQTLDVLLTTPLSGQRILREKYRGVERLIRVLWVPFLTIIFFESTWKGIVTNSWQWNGFRYEFDVTVYLVCSILSVIVYLPMIAWLSLLIGLKARTQTRAMIGSLAAIVGWCVLPVMFVGITLSILFRNSHPGTLLMLMLLSPATIIPINEFGEWHDLIRSNSSPGAWMIAFAWIATLLNFALYTLAWKWLKHRCLTHADRLLGRVEEQNGVRPTDFNFGGSESILIRWTMTAKIEICRSDPLWANSECGMRN